MSAEVVGEIYYGDFFVIIPFIYEANLSWAETISVIKCQTCPFIDKLCDGMDPTTGVGKLKSLIIYDEIEELKNEAPCIVN